MTRLVFTLAIFSIVTVRSTERYGDTESCVINNIDDNKYTSSSCRLKTEMSSERERTFLMIKPDGVQRGLVGEIIKRFEQKGFKLVGMKFLRAPRELLENHYAEHKSRPFFPGMVQYMSSGPVVPMVWEGLNVIKTGRIMLGATDPKDSAPGTIRGDLCIQVGRNMIHGSDSGESAAREINLWFKPEELTNWERENEKWIYEF